MKVKTIVELNPMQVKMILAEYLKNNGIPIIKKMRCSTEGVTVYLEEIEKDNSLVSVERGYKNEKINEIGASVKICNCLISVGISDLYQLENYIKEQIIEYPELQVKEIFCKVKGFGEKSYEELIGLLEMKKLKLREDGTIILIS